MRVSALVMGGVATLSMVALAWARGTGSQHAGLDLLSEHPIPALESEVGGIYPHPADDALILVAANRSPAYREGQVPRLPPAHRGQLLTIDGRTGAVVAGLDLGGEVYGGIASDGQLLYVSGVRPAEIIVVDRKVTRVVRRFAVDAPAGGLEYDRGRGRLLAQVYLKTPHLAVIEPKTGATRGTLWSDESAMDLKFVDGDLLCTWASGFDRFAFGELRRLDPKTGRVTGPSDERSPVGRWGSVRLSAFWRWSSSLLRVSSCQRDIASVMRWRSVASSVLRARSACSASVYLVPLRMTLTVVSVYTLNVFVRNKPLTVFVWDFLRCS